MLTFFGLTPSSRFTIYSIIHEICFNSQGAYDWDTVYNWPLWHRRFIYKKLEEHYAKQNESKDIPVKEDKKIKKPDISPTYKTKATK